MVARSASGTRGFVPAERPRVAVASDGTLAAIIEPARVAIVEIPSGAAFAEVGIDPEADSSDVMWIGAPPRLLVVSRYATRSKVHLLDPYGPRSVAEIQLETPMRLYATVGSHALAIGGQGAAVLTATEAHVTPYQFPARAIPSAAGAAGSVFVVAMSGSIEEWDPHSRMPKRRLRLPRPAAITAVGGSDRVVWMTTQQEPARIDVIPLVNRGQPKVHELPEPIAGVSSHPRSDLLVCVGAETGRLYVVDLDNRIRLRVIGPEGIDRSDAAALVLGRMVGVLAAQADRAITIVPLDGPEPDAREPAVRPAPKLAVESDAQRRGDAIESPGFAGARSDAQRRGDAIELEPEARSTLYGDDTSPDVAAAKPDVAALPDEPRTSPTDAIGSRWRAEMAGERTRSPSAPPPITPPPPHKPPTEPPRVPAWPSAEPARQAQPSLTERFSAWRERMRQPPAEEAAPASWIEALPTWRDEIVTWLRAVTAGQGDRPPPPAPSVEAMIGRFGLPPALSPVLVLLYAAHLDGKRGVAPVDVARVLGRRWDEALGRGELAARGVAHYRESRVELAPGILRALDELAPEAGVLVGTPGEVSLLGPCVVVAAERPLRSVAESCLQDVGGAILASHATADRAALFVEARAFGAVPMLRITVSDIDHIPSDPAILVVDAAVAEALDLPRLG